MNSSHPDEISPSGILTQVENFSHVNARGKVSHSDETSHSGEMPHLI